MIEFDPDKDVKNIAERGISLATADELFAGDTIETSDDRFDYGETRLVAIGKINGRVFACVYTWRGERRRVISLRPASRRERDAYQAKTS